MRHLATLGVVLVGCGYQTGSFHAAGYTFGPARATVGCVDLAIGSRAAEPTRTAVLSYAFGNGCDHPAVIDLAAARVVGRDSGGQPVTLAAYDPGSEIHSAMLDGRTVGHEAIAYTARVDVRDICVEIAGVARGPAASGVERWLCVAPSSDEEVQ